MTRDRVIFGLMLVTIVGAFFVDYVVPGFLLPAPTYAAPLLLAAYLLPSGLAAVLSAVVVGLYPVVSWSHHFPIWLTGLHEVGLVCIGFLATALDRKIRHETDLKAKAEALADERNRVVDTLHTLINTIPVGVLVSDVTGRITMANPTATNLLGKALLEGYVTEDGVDALHRASGSAHHDGEFPLIRAIEKGETVKDAEILIRGEGGTEKVVLASAAPVRNALGYVIGGVAALQDISVRQLAETALKMELETRKELETIVGRSPAVAFLWRAAKGWPVEFVSENVTQFGYTPEDFTSGAVSYEDVIHPDDRIRILAEVSRFVREGRTEFTQEYRLLTKAGQVRWVDNRTWVRRGPKGKASNFEGIVLDITQRRQAEDALRESERLYRTLVEAIDDAIVVKDSTGRYVAFNAEFVQRLGMDRDAILRKLPPDVHGPEMGEKVMAHDRLVLEGGKPVEVEEEHFGRERARICHVRKVPLRDAAGSVIGLVTVSRNITERKGAEVERERLLAEVERRAADLQDYLHIVSHDLRSPLTIIQGRGQMLQRALAKTGEEDPKLRHVEAILTSASRMNVMIQDLLDSARLESSQLEVRPVPLHLSSFISDLKERFTGILDTARVRLEAPEELPPAMADPDRLERILLNLISNGLKYSNPETTVTVRVA